MTVFLVIGFGVGYFYAGAAPTVVRLQRDVQFQHVRDGYFRKCEMTSTTGRDDNTVEEMWSCPQMRVYLVRKLATIELENR